MKPWLSPGTTPWLFPDLRSAAPTARKRRDTHVFDTDAHGHYPEPLWTSARLFDAETFGAKGALVFDPCCGWGRIPHAAAAAGYTAVGSDIVDRTGEPYACNGFRFFIHDFLKDAPSTCAPCSAVFNPPYADDRIQGFVERALAIVRYKVAALAPLRRLPAAHWLQGQPLETIWLLTPRPSLPPAAYIRAGHKPGGGGQDFCWLVFNKQARPGCVPGLRWLHRDGD
jgi:hypothetical protein